MEKLLEYIQKNSPLYFATCADNEPTIRPYGFAGIFEGKLVFAASPIGRLNKQLHANPVMEASCTDREEGTFLRMSGKAAFIDDPEKRAALVEAYPRLAMFQGHEVSFYFESGTATITNFMKQEVVYECEL